MMSEPVENPPVTTVSAAAAAAVAAEEDPEAAYEAMVRSQVMALQAEHGEAHLQKLLQQDIATCKKKDSELSIVKSKSKSAGEDVRRLQDAVRRANLAKEKGEHACRTIEETMKKREQLTESMSSEMAAHRDSFKERIEKHLSEIQAGIKEREEKVLVIEAENEELKAQMEQHKANFEAFYAQFQESMQSRTSTFEELLAGCQETTIELEKVQSQLMLIRRERNTVDSNTHTLKEQLKVYESQFETFAKSTIRPEDVANLASQQQEQAMKQITELEGHKTEANQIRLQLDKETTELRARMAALKREIAQAEKAKTAAEKKCRQAQEKMRKQKQQEEQQQQQ